MNGGKIIIPNCGACKPMHTPFCPTCPVKDNIHYRISSAIAIMSELTDEKDRHRIWDEIKRDLLPERARVMEEV